MRFIILIVTILLVSSPIKADHITLITGDLAPLAYKKDNELTGLAIDIVKEIKKRTKHSGGMAFKPWTRVVKESQQERRLSFPFARIPYREKLYKWISPILDDQFVFVARKSKSLELHSHDRLKMVNIGVARAAPTDKRLRKNGFDELVVMANESLLAKMFIRGRFDVWYSSEIYIRSFLQELKFDLSDLDILYEDLKIEFYIVASLDVDDEVVEEWQQALDSMKLDGSYKMLLDKYGI